MTGLFIRWITNTVALIAVVHTVPGIHIERWEAAALAALVLGLLNAFLRPLLIFLTLPLHIASLGFFTLLVNGFMFYLASKVVEGFYVVSFWNAFFGALLFSAISFVFNLLIDPYGKINVRFYGERSFYGRRNKRDGDVIDVEGKSKDNGDQNGKITN